MEVKCPKCRFRYETPVAAGITEAACVCPRCGSPFVYLVTEDSSPSTEVNEDVVPVRQHAAAMVSKETVPNASYEVKGEASYTREGKTTGDGRDGARGLRPTIPYGQPRQKGRSRGCLRNCLIVFLVIFIAAVIAVRNCYGDRSYTQMMLENGATESLDEFGDGLVVNDYEDFIVEGAETVPEWLQGTWRVDTESGAVVIVIHGKQIAEESGGEISRGTYYYKKKKLYCKFRESDEVEIRRVNTKRQCVVYDNRDMEKQ